MSKKNKICFGVVFGGLLAMFLMISFSSVSAASETLELNNEYNLQYVIDKYEDGITEIPISIPEDGRVRMVIGDCTSDLDINWHIGKAGEYSSLKWVYVPDFKKGVESYNSGWVTLTKGNYRAWVNLWNANREAYCKIEYQKQGEYSGECEPNNTFDSANSIQSGIVCEGDFSYDDYSNNLDVYKVTMNSSGLLCMDVKRTSVEAEESNITYCFYSEEQNGNISSEYFECSGAERLRLPQGNYYITLSPKCYKDYISDYTIKVDITYEAEDSYEQEYNNVKSSANLKLTNAWYIGNLNSKEDIDYYRFTLDKRSNLATELRVPRQSKAGLLKITLYDENLKEISTAYNTENPYLKTIPIIANAGIYYVRLESGNNATDTNYMVSDYQFCLNASEVPVRISNKKKSIKVGETVRLTLKNSVGKVIWKSKNKSIATVNKNGVVKGIKMGTTQIQGCYNGKTYNCKLTVKSKFTRGCWCKNGFYNITITKVKNNKIRFNLFMPNSNMKKKTATIQKNGRIAKCTITCSDKKKHKLLIYISGNDIKVEERSSCKTKLLQMNRKSNKKIIKCTFVPEGA